MRGSTSEIGETRVAPNGYHYTRTEDGWRLTHHIIAEQRYGRPIAANERVVFVDTDRTNLVPSNIKIVKKNVGSLRKKEARLVARIQELQAELDQVRATIKKRMEIGDDAERE
jgi:HNH endonuclease